MCTVCGCNQPDGTSAHVHAQLSDAPHSHNHEHAHEHDPHQAHTHDYGHGAAGLSVSGFSQTRLIEIEQSILSGNDRDAALNRQRFAEQDLLALNLVSSPGAGKTTLLVETVKSLRDKLAVAVIEGDQATSNDAARIEACSIPVVQINTGRGCHLDAHMVGHAFDDLPAQRGGVVFIENVGNLVCPAAFDLGEAFKVVVLSVTEGDDKPLKYPDMFAAADLMIITKIDLLPYVDFNVDEAIAGAQRINPALRDLRVSAKTDEGMSDWLTWITENCVCHA